MFVSEGGLIGYNWILGRFSRYSTTSWANSWYSRSLRISINLFQVASEHLDWIHFSSTNSSLSWFVKAWPLNSLRKSNDMPRAWPILFHKEDFFFSRLNTSFSSTLPDNENQSHMHTYNPPKSDVHFYCMQHNYENYRLTVAETSMLLRYKQSLFN